MVAYRLVELMGRASAASILGITLRELERLVEVFELSERFTTLKDRGAAITWARELNGLSKKLLSPSVVDAVVDKVNRKRITNSKDLRKLRAILVDPVAKENFLSASGDLETAMLRLAPKTPRSEPDFVLNLDTTVEAVIRRRPEQRASARDGVGAARVLVMLPASGAAIAALQNPIPETATGIPCSVAREFAS